MKSCDKIREFIPDYLTGQIELSTHNELVAHLKTCKTCQQEMEAMEYSWNSLKALPPEEPGIGLRGKFYEMLESEKRRIPPSENKPGWFYKLKLWMNKTGQQRLVPGMAYSLILLLVGFIIGSQTSYQNGDLVQLKREVNELRYITSETLLNQPSSASRMQGISYLMEINKPEQPLIQMLLTTLNEDPNVNIRLAAIDALFLVIDHGDVRAELIKSLEKQTSPLVQIALIDLIAQIKEKQALEALKTLVEKNSIDPSVKQYVQDKIKYRI